MALDFIIIGWGWFMSGREKWWEGNILHHFTLPSSSSVLTAWEDVTVPYVFIATKMLSGFAIILMDTFILLGNWLSLFRHFCGISQGFNLNLIYWVAAYWNPVLRRKWLHIQRQTAQTDLDVTVSLSINLSHICWNWHWLPTCNHGCEWPLTPQWQRVHLCHKPITLLGM